MLEFTIILTYSLQSIVVGNHGFDDDLTNNLVDVDQVKKCRLSSQRFSSRPFLGEPQRNV